MEQTTHTTNLPEFHEGKTTKTGRKFLFDLLETIALALVLFLGIKLVSAQIRVESVSMEPSLVPGDYIFVNKLAYLFTPPSRGDIVVFRYPLNPEERYIKRIIGLSNENIFVSAGQVQINGVILVEPYLQSPPIYTDQWDVPEGSFFVLGDNRNRSSDSHVWGMVPDEFLIGKALFIYWPPERFGWINVSGYSDR